MRTLLPTLAALLAVTPALTAQGTAVRDSNLAFGNGLPGQTVEIDALGVGLRLPTSFLGQRNIGLSTGTRPVPVAIFQPGATQPFLSTTFNQVPGEDYSVIVHPDPSGQPTLSVFAEDPTQRVFGAPAVLDVRHLAAAPDVDVILIDPQGAPVGTLATLRPGATGRLSIPAGSYALEVRRSSDGAFVTQSAPEELESGFLSVFHIVGDAQVAVGTLFAAFDRRPTLTEFGNDCDVPNAQFSVRVEPTEITFALVIRDLAPGSLAALNVGTANLSLDLTFLGAAGCVGSADPIVSIPIPNFLGTGFSVQTIPAAVAAVVPPTFWQFVHTGASNALGVGTTKAALLVLN